MERISKVGMIAGKASRAIRRLAIGFWYGATLICFPVASGWAQQAESARETQSERTNATDFQAVQLETQQQIARLQHDVARLEKDRRAVPTLLRQELDLWQQLELVTQERRSTKDYLAKHQASQVSSPFRDGGLTVPQSYLELDELRATMDAREEGLEALRLELQTEKTLTSEARGNFEANEQVRRRLHEVVKNSSGSNKLDGQRRQRLAQLKSRVLAARLDAHRDQALLLELRVDVAQSELTSIQQVLDELKGKFRLTREELELRLQYIEDREAEVRLQLAGVDARLRAAMYDRKDSEGASSENTTYAVAREESQLLRQLLSGVGNLKETWRRRYLLSNNKVNNFRIAGSLRSSQ